MIDYIHNISLVFKPNGIAFGLKSLTEYCIYIDTPYDSLEPETHFCEEEFVTKENYSKGKVDESSRFQQL